MQWIADLWWVWLLIAVPIVGVSLAMRAKRKKLEEGVQAQFVGTLGCAGCLYACFQIASIVMAITSVLSLILKFVIWRHS